MSLPASMCFGKIFAFYDVTDATKGTVASIVTTVPPEEATYISPCNYDFPDDSGWQAGELPFRTFVMLIALISQILVTELTYYLFVTSRKLSLRYDFLHCYKEG